MSDISITFTWWELLLYSPILGWPGLFAGAVLGVVLWRKRPIVGGLIGAVVGNVAFAYLRLMLF
jgi:hypothetical protein